MLIGLIGNISSGKSTCAKVFQDHGFEEKTFATPLKDAIKALFGFSDEQLYGSEKEVSDPRWFNITPRQVMQFVGTDLLREQMSKLIPELGNNIFMHKLKLDIRESDKNIIVSDIRFQNERDFIKSMGGIIIKIERSGLGVQSHSSEQLDDLQYDYKIENNGSLESYLKECEQFAIKFKA